MTIVGSMTQTVEATTLRDRIREMQDAGLVDPQDIAAKLADQLTDMEIRLALTTYVRVAISSDRMDTRKVTPQASAKVAVVKDWYERLMGQSVDVSGSGGTWKRLADCTRDDLLTIAAHRRELAARNIATAKVYERLAEAMSTAHVSAAGELSPDVVREVFDTATKAA